MLKTRLIMVLALPLFTGCTAIGLIHQADIGLNATEALLATSAVGTVAEAAAGNESSPIQVGGNYSNEHGFWFDEELYDVWVSSDNAKESECVARATANDACAHRGKSLNVDKTSATSLWAPALEDGKRFFLEIKFRCDVEPEGLL